MRENSFTRHVWEPGCLLTSTPRSALPVSVFPLPLRWFLGNLLFDNPFASSPRQLCSGTSTMWMMPGSVTISSRSEASRDNACSSF
ncbi:uncharacterized protein LOC144365574 isoform X3 [Ictidomys tridecemlineatus]